MNKPTTSQSSLELPDSDLFVRALTENSITVNQTEHGGTVVLHGRTCLTDWPVTCVNDITEATLDTLIALKPELIALGTGTTQQFLPAHLIAYLQKSGVACEAMHNNAAASTYNMLASDGRDVMGVFLLQPQL